VLQEGSVEKIAHFRNTVFQCFRDYGFLKTSSVQGSEGDKDHAAADDGERCERLADDHCDSFDGAGTCRLQSLGGKADGDCAGGTALDRGPDWDGLTEVGDTDVHHGSGSGDGS